MEYTKGEWRVEDRWNVLSGRRLIANCGGYHSNVEPVAEENEANAQLISSAPDLYEACKGMVKELRLHTTKWDLGMLEMIDRGDKAIAKVETPTSVKQKPSPWGKTREELEAED